MDTTIDRTRDFPQSIRHAIFFTLIVCIFSLLPQSSAVAEMRHHESHVHGQATVNIAISDRDVHIELESPAANIVGFEHSPQNHEQEQALQLAEKQLREANTLFTFNKKADCQLKSAKVTNNMEGEHHSDNHHDEEGHEDGHQHAGEHDEAQHSEFHALYHFECSQPEKLQTINIMLFESFHGFEKLDVQLLSPKGQSASTVTAQHHKINL